MIQREDHDNNPIFNDDNSVLVHVNSKKETKSNKKRLNIER